MPAMFFLRMLRFSPYATAVLLLVCISLWTAQPSWADATDPYVRRYLGVEDSVGLKLNPEGQTRLVSAANLSKGKRFFEENCKNCHVGGSTLPNPTVSLSLEALQAATPPRDSILSLVAFLREPMTYDGTEYTYSCRQVSENWLSDQEAANLAAFILRAAEKAPGWGNTTF